VFEAVPFCHANVKSIAKGAEKDRIVIERKWAKVSNKFNELYPNDKATGFKLGEFRGFIWVKENHK
jgi:hypothetical protein